MITKLRLNNYRGFQNHELSLKNTTVIVGRNNAGKSTIAEALRLISVVANRYKSLSYYSPPDWLNISVANTGVHPSLKYTEIDFQTVFYAYNEPPAVIECHFSNNCSITIYLKSEKEIHAVIKNPKGKIVQSKQQAQLFDIPEVNIMPQVGPLLKGEKILSPEYVQQAMFSSLSSLHFRNQINLNFQLFGEYQSIVAGTWPGVFIIELIGQGRMPTEHLSLEVRNENFVAEVGAMGHGLQMWLQTMWFLTIAKNSNTIILDEPDVYMHADLQRKLIRLLQKMFPQIILTTHSVEIMSEVVPDNILVVDKKLSFSAFANSLPTVQNIINSVGSVHNINLARIWHGKRLLIVEGKDMKYLKIFQSILFPMSQESFDSIPNISIGGWGGWNYAIGSSMLLTNAFNETITAYCIFDSDYHVDAEISARYEDALKKGINLHIWSKKEIENYLLVPTAIHRLISGRVAERTNPPSIKEIEDQLLIFAKELEEETFDGFATQIHSNNKALGSGGANKHAREVLKKYKTIENGLLEIVCGKTLLSKLSSWSQLKFGVSFNAINVANSLTRDEVPEEVTKVIKSIEHNTGFSTQ